MPTCRSCPAEVVFVPSAKSGAKMILDAKPEKRVVVNVPQAATSSLTILAKPGDMDAVGSVVDVYTDHHATCPRAADWRR